MFFYPDVKSQILSLIALIILLQFLFTKSVVFRGKQNKAKQNKYLCLSLCGEGRSRIRWCDGSVWTETLFSGVLIGMLSE